MHSDLEIKLKEVVEKHRGSNIELLEKLNDIAREYNTTLLHVIGWVESNLAIDGKGGLTFKGNKSISEEYTERRFKGE